MLAVDGLDVSIQQVRILRRADLAVAPGATAGLIGRNGAGKTTLMRAVMGLVPARAQRLELQGSDLRAVAAHRRAALGIGYMPEDRRLVPQMTVEENLLLPVWATRQAGLRARIPWVYELIPEVAQLAQRRAVQLSGGQQKLVALARALVCGTRLLLLDEPFEGVAPALTQRLGEIMLELKGHGLSILISESDLAHSAQLLDELFIIERGLVREHRGR